MSVYGHRRRGVTPKVNVHPPPLVRFFTVGVPLAPSRSTPRGGGVGIGVDLGDFG